MSGEAWVPSAGAAIAATTAAAAAEITGPAASGPAPPTAQKWLPGPACAVPLPAGRAPPPGPTARARRLLAG